MKQIVAAFALLLSLPAVAQWNQPPAVNGQSIAVASGSSTTPSYGFSAETGLGFYRSTSNSLSLAIVTGPQVWWGADIMRFRSTYVVGWTASNPDLGGYDTTLSRQAAGILRVGTTAGNASGTIAAAQVRLAGGAEPTCDATTRGAIVHVYGGTGVKDTVRVCAKDVADAYAYRTIY